MYGCLLSMGRCINTEVKGELDVSQRSERFNNVVGKALGRMDGPKRNVSISMSESIWSIFETTCIENYGVGPAPVLEELVRELLEMDLENAGSNI